MDGTSYAVAEVRETHVSTLFFVGDRVYKCKKPVRFGFIDLRRRTAREQACRREVELNRRLAEDVYLGTADVIGTDGRPCDHLVVMQRMPENRRLSTLLASGVDTRRQLRAVARTVAVFHASAPTSPAISEAGAWSSVVANWDDNFREMRRFTGSVLDSDLAHRIERLVRRYLAGREVLFAERIGGGFVRDGHGDLLAEDIFCLDDGPRILDCLEFADRLRYGDVLADVAFLAMDLERLGHPDLAARFLDEYAEFSGEHHPASLAHHYIAYRAHVRAKVACLRHEQGDSAAVQDAHRLLEIAYSHLERGRIVLVLIGGLPGTGKSTLASLLGRSLGWTVLRSDEVRRDVSGSGPAAEVYAHRHYSPDTTAQTYQEILRRAEQLLLRGESVVVDASLIDARWRSLAAAVAQRTSTDLVELHCEVPVGVAARRIMARLSRGDDISDATPEIAARMAVHEASWPSAISIDTNQDPVQVLGQVLRAIGLSGLAPSRQQEATAGKNRAAARSKRS
jgi:uncharacterized protein